MFLVELLVCGILTVFFLFYFNRLLATLVSYGIRAYTWHKFRAYIDIKALQISLLGGRVFFKDIRYHGHNETILVHGGYVTWRYWLRKVKEAEVFSTGPVESEDPGSPDTERRDRPSRNRSQSVGREEKGGKQSTRSLPCRITVKVSGVEVFLYNRSPGYDAVYENVTRMQSAKSRDQPVDSELKESRNIHDEGMSTASDKGIKSDVGDRARHRSGVSAQSNDANSSEKNVEKQQRPVVPAFLRLLPIRVECNKAAAVVGNENTRCIITAKVDGASGEFDASHAGPLDVFKLLFHFDFVHPVVSIKPNTDFKAPQLATAARLKQEAQGDAPVQEIRDQPSKPTHPPRKVWHALHGLSPLFRKSVESIRTISSIPGHKEYAPAFQPPFPGQDRWQGLARYLDDNQHDEHNEWDSIEYARSSTIADLPRVCMTFYWDIPGPVVSSPLDDHSDSPVTVEDDINGTLPPEYGLDLQIHGGIVNYGPWADRQRIDFQSYFFPTSYVDSVPARTLLPGETRVCTVFKLFLTVEEDTILRIPVREVSKDWKWKGQSGNAADQPKSKPAKQTAKAKGRRKSVWRRRDKGTSGPNARPFAWIDVKLYSNTTVNYVMDMVARRTGYQNNLSVDVRGSEIYTSVNHDLLWRAGGMTVDCDLSFPLGWNVLRRWQFNINCNNLELFILRDHLFLITDVVADWGSGPPPDYYTFTPFRYLLNLDFRNFRLYLNTNDSNIINNPTDFEDNDFVILYGRSLVAGLEIPLDRFRPLRNEIPFNMLGQDFGLEVSLPSRNTANTFLRSNDVAQLKEVTMTGSHNYFTETSASLTDTLTFDIHGTNFTLYAYGLLLRSLVKVKENYFGENLHFKTLEEHQGEEEVGTGDKSGAGQPTTRSNDLDVILCIVVDDADVVLAANLYAADENIAVNAPFATVDLRFTSYYMDLIVDFSPLHVSHGSASLNDGIYVNNSSRTQLLIDGIKLYGHRLFGLPPAEPAYVSNWDVNVGDVRGECPGSFVEKLIGAIKALAFGVDDDENALPVLQPVIIPDAAFLRMKTGPVHIWLHVGEEALLLSTGAATVNFNDWAGPTFSQRLNVVIPDLVLSCVDARSASRHRTRKGERHVVETYAYLQTTVSVEMLRRKLRFTEERQMQQDHMYEHDQRTGRALFLLLPGLQRPPATPLNPPALPFPAIPSPIIDDRSPTDSGSSMSSMRHSRRTQGNNPSPSVSSGSFAHSIRRGTNNATLSVPGVNDERPTLTDRTLSDWRSSDTTYALPDDEERAKRGLPPSAAFSSRLARPYFPLDTIGPDLSNVPTLPETSTKRRGSGRNLPSLDNSLTKDFEESQVYTSFIVSSERGIQAYCTPKAVEVVAELLGSIQPKRPDDLLDSFQIGVMTRILDLQKRRLGRGESIDLSLRIPCVLVRFVNTFTQQNHGGSKTERDRYDMRLDNLAIAVRQKTLPDPDVDSSSLALHVTSDSLALSVQEKAVDGMSEDVAIRTQIDDVLLWLASTDAMSVNVSFKEMENAAASKQLAYLASLIHRTTLLVDEFQARFAALDSMQQSRLRYFAYSLTKSGGDTPDPPFLSRPWYALRAVTDHLRTHDSWKIISRFRYIYQCLSDEAKEELVTSCTNERLVCPIDAEARVLSSWDQWRTWDLAHVKKSIAMRTLYGSIAGVERLHPKKPATLMLGVRSGRIKFLIDPGPRQNELTMSLLAISAAISPPSAPSGLMLVGNNELTKTTVLEINSNSVTLQLTWEICELIENMTSLFQQEHPLWDQKDYRIEPAGKHQEMLEETCHEFQAVIAIDRGTVVLDTINLRNVNMTQGLKLSLIGTDRTTTDNGIGISTVVHAHAATTELHSRARLLLRAGLDAPNIYISRNSEGGNKQIPEEWRIVGTSREVMLDIKEEIHGLVETVDAVLSDEVKYVKRQLEQFDNITPSTQTERPFPVVDVALLVDAYRIDVALIQSLSYTAIGEVARISVTPDIRRTAHTIALDLNYDLGGQAHTIRSKGHHKLHAISHLDMPSINGHLRLDQSAERTNIAVLTTIDMITLEASAIHSLLVTLTRPEVSDTIDAIKQDISVLQKHISEAFPTSPATTPLPGASETRTVLYNIGVALAGLTISETAPAKSPGSAATTLTFQVQSFRLKAANNTTGTEDTLLGPEIHAQIQRIGLELALSDEHNLQTCGNIAFGVSAHCTMQARIARPVKWDYRVKTDGLEVNLFAESASAVIDISNHLQDRLKALDLSKDRYLRRLKQPRRRGSLVKGSDGASVSDTVSIASSALFGSTYSLELLNIQISWIIGTSVPPFKGRETEDLVLSLRRIDLSSKSENGAKLTIEDFQLQMTPLSAGNKIERTQNSALLPEIVFNVAYASNSKGRQLAFQAAGKSLDLRLESQFILPANALQRSIKLAVERFRSASTTWQTTPTPTGAQRNNPLSRLRLSVLSVDADFAGAVVRLQGREGSDSLRTNLFRGNRDQVPHHGRYGQFTGKDAHTTTTLRAPGIALRVEYKDDLVEPSLNGELKIDASTNVLYPTVVPIIMDLSNCVKAVVQDKDEVPKVRRQSLVQKPSDEDNLLTTDPSVILGKTRLNLGLRVCKQEFSLSCQPIARVAASAHFDDIYITMNSVRSTEHGHFFALSANFDKLQASVQHVYSRESTFSLDVESIVLSLMNSKHLGGMAGISAILKIDPVRTQINARQLQDFLLFREIWVPPEVRKASLSAAPSAAAAPQEYLVQRYQQVAAAAAFPWHATIAITEMSVELELGQAIGKSSFTVTNLWASSRKSSDWEQSLCIGVEGVAINSTGRMSGFVELNGVKVRTSIKWPEEHGRGQTPLVQASAGFERLRAKAAFDYQVFAVADITDFHFLMYNVHQAERGAKDRLVAILDGGQIYVFCTAASAAQGLALAQAFERLIQENQIAYTDSLKDIERFLRRESTIIPTRFGPKISSASKPDTSTSLKAPISLHTDVVVTLRTLAVGAFPSTFFDNQIFKLEASDVQARFAVALEGNKIHSGLGMTLGQLRVSLASVSYPHAPKALGEVMVEDVVSIANAARSGTILRVPKVIASMQTWQEPTSNLIDYLFRSTFEGKVDVGWNYSRISFIRGMWNMHSRTLASRLGKPLPEPAVRITAAGPDDDASKDVEVSGTASERNEKITAVVNVPQSRYEYRPLETPVIETPQLRDMGEATPPLEWIGLHRDRLPNVTHQIVIVTLLEVAKEVEDAYGRILGRT